MALICMTVGIIVPESLTKIDCKAALDEATKKAHEKFDTENRKTTSEKERHSLRMLLFEERDAISDAYVRCNEKITAERVNNN